MKKITSIFPIFLLIIFSITLNNEKVVAEPTLSNRTMWKPVDSSLSDLLNSGWKLINQSSNRVATSPGASGYKPYDEENFTYTLYKNGKYITCFIGNPNPDNAYSRCRLIN